MHEAALKERQSVTGLTSWVNSDPLVSLFEFSIGKKSLRVILHDPQKPQEHSAVSDASRPRSYPSGLGGILCAGCGCDLSRAALPNGKNPRSGAMLTGPKFGRYFSTITSMSLFSYTGQTHNLDFRSKGIARQKSRGGEPEYQRLGRRVPINHKHRAGGDKGWMPVFAWWRVKG